MSTCLYRNKLKSKDFGSSSLIETVTGGATLYSGRLFVWKLNVCGVDFKWSRRLALWKCPDEGEDTRNLTKRRASLLNSPLSHNTGM